MSASRSETRLTWLEPAPGQDRREFLQSVYELTKSFPESFVATAVPVGTEGKVTMLHIVGGTREGELVQFDAALVERFKTLAAQFVSELSTEEKEAAAEAVKSREIGALSGASLDEFAVIVSTASVDRAKQLIAALFPA